MALTTDDVLRLAHLARIDIDAAEVAGVREKLAAIFDVLDALAAIDTDGVAPMAHAQDIALPLRDDVVTETDQRDAFQRFAPAVQDGLYLVPRVVE
ncbi:MAG: Asp-tRNA(Asn)/Glu-tRNA(Gln) amidotransferase subunit GatC [Casimicrobiaceae bacterium]